MADKEIKAELEYWANRLYEKYGKNHIAYIALYGSQNYDIDTEHSDVDVKAIYVPAHEEAIFSSKRVSTTLYAMSGSHCEIKDIREMNEMFLKQNINFLEILFTDYFIVNEQYSNEIYALRANAKNIAICNKPKGLCSIAGQAQSAILSYQKSNKPKTLANIIFLYEFLAKYEHNYSYDLCLWSRMNFHAPIFKKQPFRNTILALKNETLSKDEIAVIEEQLPAISNYFVSTIAKYAADINNPQPSFFETKNFLNKQALNMILKNY